MFFSSERQEEQGPGNSQVVAFDESLGEKVAESFPARHQASWLPYVPHRTTGQTNFVTLGGGPLVVQMAAGKAGKQPATGAGLLPEEGSFSPPGSSVHGILQVGILQWVALPFSRDLPDPGIEPSAPALQADSSPSEPPGNPGCEV